MLQLSGMITRSNGTIHITFQPRFNHWEVNIFPFPFLKNYTQEDKHRNCVSFVHFRRTEPHDRLYMLILSWPRANSRVVRYVPPACLPITVSPRIWSWKRQKNTHTYFARIVKPRLSLILDRSSRPESASDGPLRSSTKCETGSKATYVMHICKTLMYAMRRRFPPAAQCAGMGGG